jgi:hypothetical protein
MGKRFRRIIRAENLPDFFTLNKQDLTVPLKSRRDLELSLGISVYATSGGEL